MPPFRRSCLVAAQVAEVAIFANVIDGRMFQICVQLCLYRAPTPFSTAGTVRKRIFMSSLSDQVSMYIRSWATH